MKIVRISPFTNSINEIDIAVKPEQIATWENGTLIQDAMPDISPEHREFIKTGITPEEWNNIFRPTLISSQNNI